MFSKRFVRRVTWVASILVLLLGSFTASAQKVVVWNDVHSGPGAVAREVLAKTFQQKYPEIKVELNITEHELSKTLIRMWVTADKPPDVVGWQSGQERFHYFTRRGLVKSITDLWKKKNYDRYFSRHLKNGLSYEGEVYGIPTNVNGYCVFYVKDVWNRLGLDEPKTWEEFLNVCKKLKTEGITPISEGIRHEVWTTGKWFDYFNMRINGLPWYRRLLKLQESYTDPKVYKVMEVWKELLEKKYFTENIAAMDRVEAYMKVVNKKAGMFFGGDYERFVFEDEKDVGVFQFPVIDPNVGMYEIYHFELIFITKRAPHPKEAEVLLNFLASPEAQEILTKEDPSHPVPANKMVPKEVYMSPITEEFMKWVEKADGTMNFYDRDTYPPMYEKGYQAFADFVLNPDNYKKILTNLDVYRKKYLKEYE